MAVPSLSICIPTHPGRAATLRTTLQRIYDQLDRSPRGTVEVCVSYGGVDDGTAGLIAEFQRYGEGWLRFARVDTDFGFAHHLVDAMSMAEGDYCWIFSSDDAIAPGGILRVQTALADERDLIALTCAVAQYDSDLVEPLGDDDLFFFPDDSGRAHRYTDADTIVGQLGVSFAYLAAHVVHRDAWTRALFELQPGGGPRSRYFPHMNVFDRMINGGGAWGWLPDRVVHQRCDNDSWTPRRFGGDRSRYWTAILTDLAHLYRDMVGERRDVRRRLLCTWTRAVAGPLTMVSYKRAPGGGLHRDLRMLWGFTRALWLCPRFWCLSGPVLLIPHRLLPPTKAFEALRRQLLPLRRASL